MEQFLVILVAACVVLLLIVIFGGKKLSLRKLLYFFIEEVDAPPGTHIPTKPSQRMAARQAQTRKNANLPYTEMATLVQKIDERRRVVDSSGHSTLYDEYFELVFLTRKNERLHVTASRAAFKEIPFNQQGSLTHKKGRLVKFKTMGRVISDEFVTYHGTRSSQG